MDNMLLRNAKMLRCFAVIFLTVILGSSILASTASFGNTSLRFVGDIDYPPYSFESEGTSKGYSVDLIKVLAAVINRNVTIELMPWERCLKEIKAGTADGLIGSLTGKKWGKFMDFSDPVSEIEYAIFVKDKDRHISSIESLEGTLVGVSEKCYILDELKRNKRIEFVETRTVLDALYKLKGREITAVIAEKNAVLYYIQLYDLGEIRIISPIPDLIYQYAISLRKDSRGLLNDINVGITMLEENGTLERLSRKWFGTYLLRSFPWKKVFLMTTEITGILLVLLIVLWVVSLQATIRLKTQQIQRMSERMIEKEKLTVLGKMAGEIAHELRTPLGIIRNSAYLLRKGDPSNRALFEKRLHTLEEKVQLSSDILESILSYSRVKAETPSEVLVKDCLDKVFKDIQIPGGIKIDLITDSSTPLVVYMDLHQLYSVLRNLILNSVQAMGDAGTLTIKTLSSDNGQKVTISIRDTGRGIMETAKNKIFNLFYSTKPTGTGLGLSITKAIVEANEGELYLEESGDKGTCFVIILPSARSPDKKT